MLMKIPLHLQNENLKFCRIKKGTKKPFETDWVNKPHTWQEIETFENENYGVLCGYGGLIVIDCDTVDLKESIAKSLSDTFTVQTGSGGTHFYYICEDIKKKIILQDGDKHYGEVQAFGAQVVGPGSLHPNGKLYEVLNDVPIIKLTKEQLTTAIKPFMKEVKEEEIKVLAELKDYGESDINSIQITKVMSTSGFKKAGNGEWFGVNPWHGSSTGMNTWVNTLKNVAHCFRHDCGINVAKAIALNERIVSNCSDKLTKEDFFKVLDIAREKYGLKKYEKPPVGDLGVLNPDSKKNPAKVFSPKGRAEIFTDLQPLFYDTAGLWWLWKADEFRWTVVDEVDILNMVEEATGKDIITPRERTIILNSLKQEGRKRIPKNIKPTWIQFQDKIIDINTGDVTSATPDFFVTNPIPWKMHNENFELTPKMDEIFTEWVGQEHVKTLYQILAYSLLPDYPIHRMFCFLGSGMNGKSKFLDLMMKFVGGQNVCSTELDTLLASRFEVTRLHKKLLCVMGETNFNELSKTSTIKKLTGQDIIGFEYKNKNPFDGRNYAKIVIATNNLPETTDKTVGFYRRWCIVDFPNQFSEQKNILEDIPEEEYESLALKACGILRDLLKDRKFHNEGSLEEREKRYEDRSNFLSKFIAENCDVDDPNGFITINDFRTKFASWCMEHKFRTMSDTTIGKGMKTRGVEPGKKYFNWMNDGRGGDARVWFGIKWKIES